MSFWKKELPTLPQLRQSSLYEAEVALLGAEAELDRTFATVEMLRSKIQRLKAYDETEDTPNPLNM